jgi:hypothetical protein
MKSIVALLLQVGKIGALPSWQIKQVNSALLLIVIIVKKVKNHWMSLKDELNIAIPYLGENKDY